MFRHLEEVCYASEAADPCKILGNGVECNRDDRIDFDLALLHSVALADCYPWPMPYANTAGNRTRSYAIAQIFYEKHTSSLARYRNEA